MLYIDECTNPIGMDAAVEEADFEEQLSLDARKCLYWTSGGREALGYPHTTSNFITSHPRYAAIEAIIITDSIRFYRGVKLACCPDGVRYDVGFYRCVPWVGSNEV